MNGLFVIPAKPLARAKQRLASVLDTDRRAALVLAMLEDVTAAAVAAGPAWVLCSDEEAMQIARRCEARVIEDESPDAGLNVSLAGALRRAGTESIERVVVVASDLACVMSQDLLAIPDGAVVIAPSADGSGTNVLGLRPPGVIAPAFGAQSRWAHESAARAAGVEPVLVLSPRLALDLDSPEDLDRVRALGPGPATGSVLSTLAR